MHVDSLVSFYIATIVLACDLQVPDRGELYPHNTPPILDSACLPRMVETTRHDCQLNKSRRISVEIQLRVNGFNTYG